jgi:hypothetical protein
MRALVGLRHLLKAAGLTHLVDQDITTVAQEIIGLGDVGSMGASENSEEWAIWGLPAYDVLNSVVEAWAAQRISTRISR